jgi:IS30 family transposase
MGIDKGTTYKQPNITERRSKERWRHAKMPVLEIADKLGHATSVSYKTIYA